MAQHIQLYQVDAFTNKAFGGNPAAVCPLDTWLPDETLQNIATENNLSETAFFVPEGDGYNLRWFTPAVEVDLCGHATLASAHVLFEKLGYDRDVIQFQSKSGPLAVRKNAEGLMMDFPVWSYEKIDKHQDLTDALGQAPKEIYKATDYIAVYDHVDEILALDPDMETLKQLTEMRGVIATSAGNDNTDFVSRWFGPQVGVPEDPVTGSAHCLLTPFWSERLGKKTLRAKQISSRGGELQCVLNGKRVEITGQAVLYMQGTIYV